MRKKHGYHHLIFLSSALVCFSSLQFFPPSQASSLLTPHQPLTAGNTLVSGGGIFELGFFSLGSSNKSYVGIWYCSSRGGRIVWVANRDSPIHGSSGSLAIAGDGNLIVLDGMNSILWSSKISTSNSDIMAELLDTGNLMLSNLNGSRLWQSFDHPTDTYLPGMRVGLDLRTNANQLLTSWRSTDDPAPGNFSLGHDPNGSTQLFMWEGNLPRWRSGLWNGQVFIGIKNMIYAYSYGFKLSNIVEEQKMYYYIQSNSSEYWVLTPQGIHRHFKWNGGASWSQFWAAPVAACEEYNKCGNNGGCDMGKTPICSCLTGFVPRSSNQWEIGDWTAGCVRRTKLGCHRNESNGGIYKPDKFYLMRGVKLPDLATIVHIALDLSTCQAECMKNCYCIAFSFVTGIGCLTWGEGMMDVQIFSEGGNDLYIRLAGSEFGHEDRRVTMLITLVAVFSLGSLGCIYLLWKYEKRIKEHFKKRRSQHEENTALFGLTEIQEEGKDGKQYELRAFSFHDMVAATDNFSYENLLGEGGFGLVYKGMLSGGQQVAVKRLSKDSRQGMEEFKNEVKLISKLQHNNLVRLEGFCIQGEDMMLIYEYMHNGSLEAFLCGSSRRELLDWKTRYNIIEAVARGLLYLHRDSRLGVIHRDLKASNILLDEEMNPKISDFGIARIFEKDSNETKTKRVIGTYGYMSPEYAMQGLFSIKSDVYSFGVLLLEIVSGKRNNTYQHPELCLHLLPYAWKLWNENNEMELADPLIRDSCQVEEVSRCIQVGLLCVQDQATDRPTMSSVVMMLEWRTITHPMPKEPIFAMDKSTHKRKSPTQDQEDASNDVSITLLTGRT